MADLIDRQMTIDVLCKSECGWNNAECRHKDDTDFCVTCDNVKIIKTLPSVQSDIIRCKDCKHWNPQFKTANGNGLGSCDFHNVALVTSEGFCYWAERGEQNDSEAD